MLAAASRGAEREKQKEKKKGPQVINKSQLLRFRRKGLKVQVCKEEFRKKKKCAPACASSYYLSLCLLGSTGV